ncbi:hypothetical protein pb186bvf_018324 [Paramecium bursaria]
MQQDFSKVSSEEILQFLKEKNIFIRQYQDFEKKLSAINQELVEILWDPYYGQQIKAYSLSSNYSSDPNKYSVDLEDIFLGSSRPISRSQISPIELRKNNQTDNQISLNRMSRVEIMDSSRSTTEQNHQQKMKLNYFT